MKKSLIVLAVMGMVLACSQAVFAASYRSDFLVFDGCPSCPDPCAQIATDLSTLCSGMHSGINGYITFKSTRDGGWDVTVYIFHAYPGYPYEVKSNHLFLGDKPEYAHVDDKDTTGILIPSTLETGKKGKPTGYASGTLSFHLTKAVASTLGDVICVFADCDAPQPGYPESKDCSHFNLLYATNWAYWRSL